MQFLRVLYLPPFPPSISYRPWSCEREEISLLRWLVERLLARGSAGSLLVACHHETDRAKAEEALRKLGVLVLFCRGNTLLSTAGEIAAVFPRLPIAYFRPEMMFAPTDLLDRMAEHHAEHENDFTAAEDLPALLAPEIASPGLLAALARIDFGGSAPSPGEAVRRLAQLRTGSLTGPPLRAIPFTAALFYSLPVFPRVSPLQTADDAQRARQALAGLPSSCAFEALERWSATRFDPVAMLGHIEPGDSAKPRILYISPGSLYSGAEESLRSMAEGLAAFEFEQTAVVSLDGILAQRLTETGCRVICANWYFSAPPSDASADHSADRYAAAVLDRIRPDFIHCNGDPGPGFLLQARKRGIPLVAHVRNVKFTGGEDLFAASTHLIAVSRFVKRRLEETGVPGSRITVVYNGVDTDRFVPGVFDQAAMREKFGLPADAFVVVMIASFVHGKRHDLMLEAFGHFQRCNPSARLVLTGFPVDSGIVHSVHESIARLVRPDSVTMLPFQTDIREIECAADAVALPSDSEALARCILEAMSLGIPAVASDNGGTCELFEHGVSGLAMTGGDAASLTAALLELHHNGNLRNRIALEARKRVEACFTLREYARQVRSVLLNCTGITYWDETCRDRGSAAPRK